jgi:hypothetical protein
VPDIIQVGSSSKSSDYNSENTDSISVGATISIDNFYVFPQFLQINAGGIPDVIKDSFSLSRFSSKT